MATIYVDENKNIHALGSIIDSLPVGSIVLWPSNTVPAGWFICNGDAVSRTKCEDLFSVVGISYGPGDNSTTFNLPDFRGRTPVGVNDGTGSVSETFSLASSGGEVTHTLTINEIPSHRHTIHGRIDRYQGSGTAFREPYSYNEGGGTDNNIDTYATGGDQAHNNMQPYLVVNYIIKAFYGVSASGGQGGDASSDIIVIGQESDVTEDTKLLVEPEDLEPNGSEVVNTLENNESTKAPSVRAVNQALSSLKRVYSEEETIIGTWFGKPLYARTVIYTPGGTVTDLQVPLGDTTMTFVRPVEISCIRPNGICVNIDWFDRQSGAHTNMYIDEQRRLRGEATVDDLTQSTWYIYLEYIKDMELT